MKKVLLICAAAALVAGCRGDSVRRDQQPYQTVQEGSASGITSTINAPGATAPPLTATNADTTSDLSLPVATTGSAFGQAGNLAGTLPANQSGSMSVPNPVDTTGATVPRAGRPVAQRPTGMQPAARPSEPAQPMTSATQPERSAPSPHPSVEPPTDTTATTAPPADATTTTSPENKPKEKPKEEPPPPSSTDTSTTTSPPPTQT